MTIQAKAQFKINKPAKDIFDAIVDPTKLCQYFTSTASAPMIEGTSVTWIWEDFDAEFLIDIQKVEPNKNVVFRWPATGIESVVDITLDSLDANSTLIRVIETGWELNVQGAEYANRQTGGWTHMFLCLKAFLEYGINLRDGSVCRQSFD
jgi:uncharacterized protein YndB with AHSA1/START domain